MKYRKALLALGAIALAAPLALAPAPALASIPRPICDVECDPPPPPPPPPTPPSGGVVPVACTPGYISNQNANGFWQDTGVANVNDVAAGADGSLWYVTGTPSDIGTTVRVSGGTTRIINQGGKRIAIDAQGNPWIVDFNGNIWHLVNGAFQPLGSGQARDIAVAPDGTVWVIGTNSRNGSYQVYSWNGSSWSQNPGSGEEIDVAANGDPVVNGVDGKVWIMNGGADSGWSQVTEVGSLPVFDMGLSRCSPTGQADVGGSAMWFVTDDINTAPDSGQLLFSLGGGEVGAYATTTSGFVVEKFLNGKFQITAAHVAVDTQGRVWVVAEPGGCDCPGELLMRPLN